MDRNCMLTMRAVMISLAAVNYYCKQALLNHNNGKYKIMSFDYKQLLFSAHEHKTCKETERVDATPEVMDARRLGAPGYAKL
eukprot:scaffold27151_cov19-Prasinocladus_malaysianus.AAC.1